MAQPDCSISLEGTIIKKVHQHCNKYVHSCQECQQVTLKELLYISLHLSIPQFPMSFISMDL